MKWEKPWPCPFCGVQAEITTWYDERRECWTASVECEACEYEMYASAKDRERARQRVQDKWNRRANQ